MPMYSSVCRECGAQHSYVRRIAERNDTPLCHGRPTDKVLDTPMVQATFGATKGAYMHQTGEYVEGTQMHDYYRKHNLISTTEGNREADLQRANRAAEHDKVRRKAAEEAVRTHLG